jgi:hypothetical protein
MTDSPTLLQRCTFGAYAATEPWPSVQPHYDLEASIGSKLPIMSWFQGLSNSWLRTQSADAAESGHDLQIALAPGLAGGIAVPFTDILSGKWNTRLDKYFTGAATYPHNVTIRFCHEMNMSQHPWSIRNQSPCTTDLNVWLDTWRYVVDRQRAIGGNVRWQWCVGGIDMGGVPAETYWPGADYVDVIGIDVYNGYGPYTPPAKLIKSMYDRVTALDPDAPVWLSEVGCREPRTGEAWDKAGWYRDLFALTGFPRMEAIIFFNMNKEFDWRITGQDVQPQVAGLLNTAGYLSR